MEYSRSRKLEEKVAFKILFLGGLSIFIINVAIFVFIFKESSTLFFDLDQRNDISLYHDTLNEESFERDSSIFQVLDNFLGQSIWQPVSDQPLYSLWPLAVGTFKITVVAVFIGTIISFFSAIGMAFYLPKRFGYMVKVITELLAGIPSVVLGFLGLIVFASIFQDIFGFDYRLNGFTAGAILSLTVIPIITTLFEDVYSSYPKDQILAAKSIGLYDYQVVKNIIVPASFGKILAAVLLGFGRCFGETMIVLMCSGNAAVLSADLASGARTFAATIGSEMADVIVGDTHYAILFFIGVILLITTFLINYFSQRLIRRFTYV